MIPRNKLSYYRLKEREKENRFVMNIVLIFIIALIMFLVSVISIKLILSTNINTVSYSNMYKLIQIQGIDNKKALLIIENEPYNNWNEVLEIDGIGETTVKRLKEKFYIKQETLLRDWN